MNKVTLEWFDSLEDLRRTDDTFGKLYKVYKYVTKIMFVFERDGSARVYLRQAEEDSTKFTNTVLIGLVHTKKEAREMYKAITFEDLK